MRAIKSCLAILLIIPFLKPAYFGNIEMLNLAFNIARAVSFCIIVLYYVFAHKRISRIMIVVLIFQVGLFISTMINHLDYMRVAYDCISILGYCMFIEAFINDFTFLCKIILIPAMIIAIVNLLFIFVNPPNAELLDTYGSFIGHRNHQVGILLLSVYMSLLQSHYRSESINFKTITMLLISIITVVWIWSATSLVGVAMMAVFMFFIYKKNYSRVFNPVVYIGVSVVAFVSVVVIRLQERISLISFIIEDVLKKDVTFTGRTGLWDMKFIQIKEKPFLGYGVEPSEIRSQVESSIGAHNYYLDITYQGGFIALALFIILIVMASEKLMKNKENQITNIIGFSVFCYLVMFQGESHFSFLFYFSGLLILAYHVENIIKQHENFKMLKKITSMKY